MWVGEWVWVDWLVGVHANIHGHIYIRRLQACLLISISISSISGVPAGRRGEAAAIHICAYTHAHMYTHTYYMLGGEEEAAAVLI